MKSEAGRPRAFRATGAGKPWLLYAAAALVTAPTALAAQQADPRVGLAPGLTNAGEAIWNLELVASQARPSGFFDSANMGNLDLANSDLAFSGNSMIIGSFHGFNIYDISNPASPTLRVSVVCPGGQGDVSVFGNLLFMSVEQPRGRVDCGAGGVSAPVSTERFRGVRIFDIANLDTPRQVAAVQTCRGSHTHTLLKSPGDAANVYVYVSGTGGVRPAEELAGCSGLAPEDDPNTALFRIEVIQVPLAAPEQARVVSAPRVFADPATGAVGGIFSLDRSGVQASASQACHDVTTYPEIGLAAGACSGNGILLDISDPINPRRITEVADSNFAYWHSATFNNDGSKVLFTDEWGGGTAPRCRADDPITWGANAIFDRINGELRFGSYFKIPAAQTDQENCVAHNGSLIPVPGRDIKVQAWYQGGISIFDFTDASNPVEIAYFDRGPISGDRLVTGGYWSSYWYNGHIYGSEIARGLDVFRLRPSEHLSQNEIDAANAVRMTEFNPQHQTRFVWPAEFVVARAYLDQLARSGALDGAGAATLSAEIDRAEGAGGEAEARAALERLAGVAEQLRGDAETATAAGRLTDGDRFTALAGTLDALVAERLR